MELDYAYGSTSRNKNFRKKKGKVHTPHPKSSAKTSVVNRIGVVEIEHENISINENLSTTENGDVKNLKF
jgi:hypothetical protein